VSAPFHCALMAPAADAMREALARTKKGALAIPVVANVRAEPVMDAAEEADLLVAQVTGRVRWSETVSWLAANGVDTLHEIGAGKVLTGLARRIDKTLATTSVGSPVEIEQALASLLSSARRSG
ncbi:MAG: ACP S-malonyltransferase, partial [Pararhizobium sp.]